MKINLERIKNKHNKLIKSCYLLMEKVDDPEHDINHINDVVKNIIILSELLKVEFNSEVCVIAAYWHDVGRIEKSEGHEKLSAEILKKEMIKLNYNKEFINKCYSAIEFHKWDMTPKTIEGKILKDADKLAWLGINRLNSCIKNNKRLDNILNLLPKLRNEILYFDESKIIFDKQVIDLISLLYNKI